MTELTRRVGGFLKPSHSPEVIPIVVPGRIEQVFGALAGRKDTVIGGALPACRARRGELIALKLRGFDDARVGVAQEAQIVGHPSVLDQGVNDFALTIPFGFQRLAWLARWLDDWWKAPGWKLTREDTSKHGINKSVLADLIKRGREICGVSHPERMLDQRAGVQLVTLAGHEHVRERCVESVRHVGVANRKLDLMEALLPICRDLLLQSTDVEAG